jgi:hypothetical protein
LNSVCLLNVDGRYFCAIFQNVSNLGPATDFYKKLALDCSAQQVAVDLIFGCLNFKTIFDIKIKVAITIF